MRMILKNKLGFLMVPALLSVFVISCSKKAEVAETSTTPSPTALIDGLYKSGCWNLDIDSDTVTDGLKVVFKIENGNSHSGYLFYNHDTACAGASSLRSPLDFTVITDLIPDSTNMQFLSVTGVPSDFYVMSAYDVSASVTAFNVMYRLDADHIYLLADAVLTNPGAAWSDWTGASTDVVGFAAAPTTFTPGSGGAQGGGDSVVIPLAKATSI